MLFLQWQKLTFIDISWFSTNFQSQIQLSNFLAPLERFFTPELPDLALSTLITLKYVRINHGDQRFFQLEFIINVSFCFNWIHMLWVYVHYIFLNYFPAITKHLHSIYTMLDQRQIHLRLVTIKKFPQACQLAFCDQSSPPSPDGLVGMTLQYRVELKYVVFSSDWSD